MSSQRGILTFFSKKQTSKGKGEGGEEDEGEEAVIQQPKKKRRVMIESDGEGEDGCDKMEDDGCDKMEDDGSIPSNGLTPSNGSCTKTPPKRVTARKHTGPVKRNISRPAAANLMKESPTIHKEVNDYVETKDNMEVDPDINDISAGNEDVLAKEKENVKLSSSIIPNKDGSIYNPSTTPYHPINDANWNRNQKVPYLSIAKTFELIEQESGRLKIISILTNFLRSVIALSPHELSKCIYLCLNKLGPAYEGVELGIGESILIKALSSATGRNSQHIKNEISEKGDLGLVAEGSRSTQKMMFTPPPLTITGVFNKLKDIAKLTGHSSQNKKVEMIKGLFVACKECEAKYLIRSLGGKLRIGLAEQSVLVALAHAVVYTPPGQEWPLQVIDASKGISGEKFKKELDNAVGLVKNAYCELPNYDTLISALLKYGVEQLPVHCSLTAGIPLKPMLAHPTKGIQDVLHRLDQVDFTCEWKYDGERAQIHILSNGNVQIYSRNQENNTSKYPDIIKLVPMVLNEGVESCVIDSEVVAWDSEKSQILPFQILSTRKRKVSGCQPLMVILWGESC
jgi:DNA ligase-1